jgi:hypothetical protein
MGRIFVLSTCAFADVLGEVVIKSRKWAKYPSCGKLSYHRNAIRRFGAYCRRSNQSELLQYMSNARKLALTESQAACLIALRDREDSQLKVAIDATLAAAQRRSH